MSATLTQGFQHNLISISGEKNTHTFKHSERPFFFPQSKTLWNVRVVLYVNLALFGLQAGGDMIMSHLSVLQWREGACKTDKKMLKKPSCADRLDAPSLHVAAAPRASHSKHGEQLF